jgi:hypothetical protein
MHGTGFACQINEKLQKKINKSIQWIVLFKLPFEVEKEANLYSSKEWSNPEMEVSAILRVGGCNMAIGTWTVRVCQTKICWNKIKQIKNLSF